MSKLAQRLDRLEKAAKKHRIGVCKLCYGYPVAAIDLMHEMDQWTGVPEDRRVLSNGGRTEANPRGGGFGSTKESHVRHRPLMGATDHKLIS